MDRHAALRAVVAQAQTERRLGLGPPVAEGDRAGAAEVDAYPAATAITGGDGQLQPLPGGAGIAPSPQRQGRMGAGADAVEAGVASQRIDFRQVRRQTACAELPQQASQGFVSPLRGDLSPPIGELFQAPVQGTAEECPPVEPRLHAGGEILALTTPCLNRKEGEPDFAQAVVAQGTIKPGDPLFKTQARSPGTIGAISDGEFQATDAPAIELEQITRAQGVNTGDDAEAGARTAAITGEKGGISVVGGGCVGIRRPQRLLRAGGHAQSAAVAAFTVQAQAVFIKAPSLAGTVFDATAAGGRRESMMDATLAEPLDDGQWRIREEVPERHRRSERRCVHRHVAGWRQLLARSPLGQFPLQLLRIGAG